MDFLDPRKKRAHNIRLYIGYILMAVVLGISTLILVFAAYGYSIDRKTGDVIQNGLVIVDAHPESATIFVNGDGKGTTGNRLILPAGKYKIELQRQNYRSWTHDIDLEGSSIEQLVYPFLFPTDLNAKPILDYTNAPSMASQSLDRRWLVLHQPNSDNSFQVINLSDPDAAVATIVLPQDAFTTAAGAHTYEAVEWSSDNSNLLLKHNFAGGSEFVVLNRDTPASSVNLSKVFASQPFTSISLRDKKPDQFYLHNSVDGGVYQASTASRTATLLLTKVTNFKSYQDDTILYATPAPTNPAESEVRIRRGNQDYLIRRVPSAVAFLLDMAEFKGKFYLVAGSPTDGRVYIYKDPFAELTRQPTREPQAFRVLVMPGAQYLSFSSIARFVTVQSGGNFAVYDLETNRQFKYDSGLPLSPGQKATWMDGHRLTLVSANDLFAFDFDGTNMQKLITSHTGFLPFFDRDYTALLTLAPNETRTKLQRAELIVAADSAP